MLPLYKRLILPFILCLCLLLAWSKTPRPNAQRLHASVNKHASSTNWTSSASTSNKTVNLVIASLQADDISWTANLDLPNLNVIRYIIDAPEAPYRTPVTGKGPEALVYHAYFYDFYHKLPDISIMIHPHEDPWHIEGVLQQSMLFTLSHLDLDVVQCRQYANLGVSWHQACPYWIDTTKTFDNALKQEEPYMRSATVANFGVTDTEVPKNFAGPCCSQFVVTREAVQRNPRQQYKRNMDWLVQTTLPEYISGRVWERMWAYLFKQQAVDCPTEWKTYCAMYHVCFEDPNAPSEYNRLWREKNALKEDTEFWREVLDPQAGVNARKRIRDIEFLLEKQLETALVRGEIDDIRVTARDICDP